jgi:hypothetical protein
MMVSRLVLCPHLSLSQREREFMIKWFDVAHHRRDRNWTPRIKTFRGDAIRINSYLSQRSFTASG